MDSSAVGTSARSGATAPPTPVLGVIGEPMDGVGYIRFVQPFAHLAADGFSLRKLGRELTLTRRPRGYEVDPSLLDGVAAVIFPQLVASPTLADGSRVEVVRSLCVEARRREIPVVYSVDDLLSHIEPQNPGYERVRGSLDNLELIREHASAVIVTTEPLRDAFAPWGLPIHHLPNAVDPAHWRERPRRSVELRIGWTGSGSHLDDLLLVAPAIRELRRRIDFRFVLQGLLDKPFDEQIAEIERDRTAYGPAQRERAERFLQLADLLAEVDFLHRPFVPTGSFFDLLPSLDLDVGICPLLETPFNRHKSANKFYEYAMTGTMTVASRVTPYAEEVSVTVPNDPLEWRETLERHLRDECLRERELAEQREFVLAERRIDRLRPRWARCLMETTHAVRPV